MGRTLAYVHCTRNKSAYPVIDYSECDISCATPSYRPSMSTLKLDPKNHTKVWRKGQKSCEWCGYPIGVSVHGHCQQKPDWHDHKAYWSWMGNKNRPTGDKSRARVLNEWDAHLYYKYLQNNEWRAQKEAEMYYD